MKSIKEYILLYCRQIASIMRNEYRAIFADPGVMLVIIFAKANTRTDKCI